MIYLDHNATSTLRPEARDAMAPWWEVPANPSSAHRLGQRARAAVERAREHVAALVGAALSDVVFTSGATEANHLALRGAWRRVGGRIVLSAAEHPCVHAAAAALVEQGADLTVLPLDDRGVVRLDEAPERASVVSILTASHETGVIQPLRQVATRWPDVWRHTDASQAAGRVDLQGLPVHGLTLSAHKLGGPVGVGALVVRDDPSFPPLFAGSQERGRRGGTVPTALVVGFGEAARLAAARRVETVDRWHAQRARLEVVVRGLGGAVIGAEVPRVANTLLVVFPGLSGEALVQALDLRGIGASAGAACASGSLEPSPTLRAMGHPEPGGALRLSLGHDTTHDDVQAVVEALPQVVRGLRAAAAPEA